jgi:hypothetical protein
MEPYLREIFATGPREAWEQEQLVPGSGGEAVHDPIVEATELFARADRDRARGLLAGLLAERLDHNQELYRLSVGRLAVKRASFGKFEIEELDVGRLRVREGSDLH